MPGPDPDVAKKADQTILLAGITLWLLNGEDKPGDVVHIKKGKFIRWHNRTGANCTLKFYKLPDVDEGPSAAVAYWPFVPGATPAEKVLTPDEVWKAKLRDDIEPGIHIKYDVELCQLPHVPKLDPVIIIKPSQGQ